MSQAVQDSRPEAELSHSAENGWVHAHARATGGTLEAKAVIVQVFAKHDRSW